MEELLERSAAAYAARTRAELDALFGDLPDETRNAGEAQKQGWRDQAWRLHVTLTVLINGAVTGLWLVTRDRTPSPTDEGAANSRANRCTHRYTVTWSTSMPRSASSSCRSR
jgi:hypothetical protein